LELNKINVLDKGFVAPLEFTGNSRLLQDIQDSYFKTKTNLDLLKLSSATLVIKCPLFVQLNLSKYDFDIISTPSDNVEAYVPDVSMIKGDTLEDRQRVAQYVAATTEALLLNQKGLPMDGIDEFTAQLLTPINVYNQIIVNGKLEQWIRFLKQKRLPRELQMYQETIKDILKVSIKNLENLLKIM
jgi:hypothetical protein